MKKYILFFIALIIVFPGCSKTSEVVYIDRYSKDELLNHRNNLSLDTNESPNQYTSGDLNPDSSVFVTKTGKKYHTAACHHLKNNGNEITLREAMSKNLTPCSYCNPDKQ